MGPHGQEALRKILGYLMGVNDALTPESLSTLLRQLPPDAKDTIMTLAEQFVARGKAEGKAEGERNLLLRLLALEFGELPEDARRRVEAGDEDALMRWAERVLVATRLEDVFGE